MHLSPTGFFHISGARTAFFNYLFVKYINDDLNVQIEDTDIKHMLLLELIHNFQFLNDWEFNMMNQQQS